VSACSWLLLDAHGRAHWARESGSVSGARFARPCSPWPDPFPPPIPQLSCSLCSSASLVLWVCPTALPRASPVDGHWPYRRVPPRYLRRATQGSPGSRARSFRTCDGSPTARGRPEARDVAFRSCGLPPRLTASAPRSVWFRGSIPCPCVPLSMLRRRSREQLRMTRGHRGSLALRCEALSSSTSCRLIPAH